MGQLDGKIIIITGAAHGQGEAEARLFAKEGARVVLTDQDDRGRAVADEIGTGAMFVQHDVAFQPDWARVVNAALEYFGGIDVLINNAAIFQLAALQDTEVEVFERTYRINQLGVFFGMAAVVPPMRARGGGAIVNIASAAALKGQAGAFAYSTSKWAVRGMSRCAAADLGVYGIRVNAIFPGLIDTQMIAGHPRAAIESAAANFPLRRVGKPIEVAEVAAFLASDAAGYVTGAEISVDGGFMA